MERGQPASAPVNTVQPNKPHQPMAGKRIPAASTGDAQPMIPGGGMTLRRIPAGARQSACFSSLHQTNAHGSARSAVDVVQRKSASRTETSGPKKFFAPGTSGQRAAQ